MQKLHFLKSLQLAGVIAVIRHDTKVGAIKASEAVIAGGMKGIELTFTVPDADQAIRELRNKYQDNPEIIIGAGTVLEAFTARLAILAGAQFIVSPTFDLDTAEVCNLYQIPYLPGCMTISEARIALKAGVDIIKLFPGNLYGPAIIKAFKAPIPHLNMMPTGGVDVENMADWFEAGAVAVGVGGNLLASAKTNNFAEVTKMASIYMAKYQQIKGE
ncbi:bifunctional 2-keto-4-hydroxyglutarate aldolase/2-keto-3-deoxy-6-phosphogluconate aldolase [Listeria sp. FSL L7-1582]|uniref:bifunctional 2-keto-4-hydroxyglutarate aldolase/2-keto-3-deoxy-6-phosphogluconate aldolase n=1 Tax=Listeria portnoyi TaxID=2713504 RepID=UPI00164E126A|nr:bifunctional 2-keto-4-hydroxyglutarate aldolase/2-keto-3-deoxy-6-phosphogluconate aldolase [Listeria portnoyi]MBC6308734.1 bifunctional 2-keto-4-hydroxyglutarate aldolase/2-keto-3-deoxy-6-phosphogluconate aldolase [Listeria portnoyi]